MASPSDLVIGALMGSPDAMAQIAEMEPERMTEEELVAYLRREVEDAASWTGGKLSAERTRALRDYFGEKDGKERPGRSSIVMRDVLETVEAMMPSLMEVFFSGDETVRFEPQGPEDEAAAEQATDYCNFIFLRDNPGFEIGYTWFKDALLQKVGVVKCFWEMAETSDVETHEGLTGYALADLANTQDELTWLSYATRQVQGVDPYGAPVVEELHDVSVRRVRREGRVRVVAVPPDEFGVSKDARSLDDAAVVYHRVKSSEAQLIAQGFDPEVVKGLPSSEDWGFTAERQMRASQDTGVTWEGADGRTDASRTIWVTECYTRVDFDGDGRPELRRVTLGSHDAVVLANEEIAELPFAVISPVLVPHRFYGLSIADLVKDIQEIRTALGRNFIDAELLATNPRHAVLGTPEAGPQCDVDELISSVIGGYVTEYQQNAIRPLIERSVASTALPALEWMETQREKRTGVTAYQQGLDAQHLNKTATGISLIQNAAAAKLGLVARIFAETGVKRLFELIYGLVVRHQQGERIVRLRNEFVPIDPTAWKRKMDATISVGLGHGNRESKIAGVMQILGWQERVVEIAPMLVSPEHAFNALRRGVQALGFKNPDEFFQSPEKAGPPPPPPPDPKLVEIESRERIEREKLRLQELEIRLKYRAEAGWLLLDAQKQREQQAQQALEAAQAMEPAADPMEGQSA